jgi:hypothetical protein
MSTLACGAGPAKCVLCRLGRCAQKEAGLPMQNVSGLAGEVIMLCMEPLCVRMMQLASLTIASGQVISISISISVMAFHVCDRFLAEI